MKLKERPLFSKIYAFIQKKPGYTSAFIIIFWLLVVTINIRTILNVGSNVADEATLSSSSKTESSFADDIISKSKEDVSFLLIIQTKNGSDILTEENRLVINKVIDSFISDPEIGPFLTSHSPYNSIFDDFDNMLRNTLSLQWLSTQYFMASSHIILGILTNYCNKLTYYYNLTRNVSTAIDSTNSYIYSDIPNMLSSINATRYLPIATSYFNELSSLFIDEVMPFNDLANTSLLIEKTYALVTNNQTFFSSIINNQELLDISLFVSSNFSINQWLNYSYAIKKASEFFFNNTEPQYVNFVYEVYNNGSLDNFVKVKNKYFFPLLKQKMTIPVIDTHLVSLLLKLYTNFDMSKTMANATIIKFHSFYSHNTPSGRRMYEKVISLLPLLAKAFKGYNFYTTSYEMFIVELNNDTAEQAHKMDLIVIVAITIILFLVYRSPILPLIQLVTIIVAMGVSRIAFALVSNVSNNLTNTSLMFMSVSLLGASTDYCVFIIGDYLLHLKKNMSKNKALKTALSRTASSIVVSSISLSIGFGSLILGRLPTIKGVGIGGALGFIIGMVVSLTLAPSILYFISKDSLLKWQIHIPSSLTKRISVNKILKSNIKKATRAVVISTIIAALGFTLFFITPLDYAQINSAPDKYVSKQGFNAMEEYIGGDKLNQIIVLFEAPTNESFITVNGSINYSLITLIEPLVSEIMNESSLLYAYGVCRPFGSYYLKSIYNGSYFMEKELELSMKSYVLADTHYALVMFGSQYTEGDAKLMAQIRTVRAILENNIDNAFPSGWHAYVTGFPVRIYDDIITFQQDFITIAVIIVISIMALLTLFLKDIFMAIRILFTIIISIGISVGLFVILSYLFFGGKILFFIPVFLFGVLIALGLDFDVLFLGIYRRMLISTNNDTEKSILFALQQTMSNISIAGLIMAVTYFSLIFTSSLQMNETGIGLSLGILIDVFVSRIFIVPAAVVITTRFEAKKYRLLRGKKK